MKTCEKCGGRGEIQKEWTEGEFEDYLNDCYPDVEICGLKYSAGHALRMVDEVAFTCAMNDFDEYEDCPNCEGSGEVEDEDVNATAQETENKEKTYT